MTDESINKKTSEDSLEYASEITEEVPSVKDFYQNLSGKYVYCPENSDGKQARSRKGALTFAIIMSAAFILSLGALLLVLLLPPKPQASAIISYNELYEKCAPFSVSIETADGSIGSGFFITEGGRIVTNYHVVGTSKTVTVHTYEGKTYAAQVSAYDKTNDIAIVDVITTGNETFSYAEFADSSTVKTGDPVMVIGSPEKISLGWTMTVGYVSSADRKESSDKNARSFIQFDAAVNPGNSGGPLINLNGQVIGVVQSKASGNNYVYDTAGNVIGYTDYYFEGIGFAIPSNTASSIVDRLVQSLTNGDQNEDDTANDNETVPNAQLGISGISVYKDQEYFMTDELLFYVKTDTESNQKYIMKDSEIIYLTEEVLKTGRYFKPQHDGVLILKVHEGTGAYEKILENDILFGIDGVLINRYNAYIYTGGYELVDLVLDLMPSYKAGDTVTVNIERDGSEIESKITLTARAS